MKIRSVVKRILGDKGLETAVNIKKKLAYCSAMIHGKNEQIVIHDATNSFVYHIKDKNVFFGYYDLKSYNRVGDKLIAHIVDKDANPVNNPAEIAWFEPGNGTPHIVGQTRAWCWQQGARLRWHPTEPDCILYNDFKDDRYVLVKTNVIDNKTEIIGTALYDVDTSFMFGLTLNYSRLQRMRAGYGYLILEDPHMGQKAPVNDGVFRVNMQTGEKKLLYSLKDLAKGVEDDGFHYINHLSFSPDGQHFIFFHIWTQSDGWKMRLYVSNITGTQLKRLTDNIIMSHYCWTDNDNLIVTTNEGEYLHLNIQNGCQHKIKEEHLIRDGHPSRYHDGFISDTYPLKDHTQRVFYCNMDGTGYREIASVFSDPTKYGEHRCDLHPRVEADGRITIDTTAVGGVRSMVAFDIGACDNLIK